MLDIEDQNLENRIEQWEKILSLKGILTEEYIPELIFEEILHLENGKEISRVYLQLDGVSIHNKATWRQTMEFFNENMSKLEAFYLEYQDIIKA